jgi:hypothetical protein
MASANSVTWHGNGANAGEVAQEDEITLIRCIQYKR